MAQAVKQIEDSRCPKCGLLAWHAYSTDNRIQFECEDLICEACAEKERVEGKEKDRKEGATKVVRAVPAIEGEPLPSRRDFYERMQKEKELEERLKQAS